MEKTFYVYILSSVSRKLYVGVTSDLEGRVWQHKHKEGSTFTKKYHIDQLVWYEETDDWNAAFEEEKRLKSWRREKKIKLIEENNAGWLDLSEDWYK